MASKVVFRFPTRSVQDDFINGLVSGWGSKHVDVRCPDDSDPMDAEEITVTWADDGNS